jgi:hypothetical protein
MRPHVFNLNRAECGVTFDESASVTRLDKMISSLCTVEESPKLCMPASMAGSQYSSSQLYSHVPGIAPGVSRCYIPSNVNNEYTDMGGLSG